MLRRSKLSRKSKNRACLVQGSCVTCTEVGVGDSLSERRSCVDGIHPPHRTAEENFSRQVNQVEVICPLAKNPLPPMMAKEDVMLDGVRMIGANMIGANPKILHASTEYIKIRVVGEDRMALKDGPRAALSAVGSSKVAETPEDTASGKTRNSEGGNGQGSAALLSDPPISNHSRALGGGAKLRRAAHAEVPSAKLDLVNTPIKETITQPRLDNSGNVWGRGAVEKVPEEQILERRKPEKNNPPKGPKNVKKLELPHTSRLIKKAKRQKKYTSVRNGDQLPITNFLRGVPTPEDSSSKQQVKVIGTATPGSGPGLGGAVQTVVQKKLNKRKFTDNDDFLREAKFVKMEKSDALPHKGGLEVGEVETPSTLKSEGKTLKNRTNNQSDISI